MIFKFNDLKFQGSFLALRIEGDKLSIEERIKDESSKSDAAKEELLSDIQSLESRRGPRILCA